MLIAKVCSKVQMMGNDDHHRIYANFIRLVIVMFSQTNNQTRANEMHETLFIFSFRLVRIEKKAKRDLMNKVKRRQHQLSGGAVKIGTEKSFARDGDETIIWPRPAKFSVQR